MSSSPARHLLAGVVTLDTLVAKATSPYQLALQLEARLSRVLSGTFARRASAGLTAAGDALARGTGPMVQADVDAYVHRVGLAFEGWQTELEPLFRVILGAAYKSAAETVYRRATGGVSRTAAYDAPKRVKKAAPKKAANGGLPKGSKVLELKPNFQQKDQAAIDGMVKAQMFWVGKFQTAKLDTAIANSVKASLSFGLGRREMAKVLDKKLTAMFGFQGGSEGDLAMPGGFRGTALQYLDVVAAAAITSARTNGALRALPNIGVTHYEVVNPMDERTCSICSYMDGKSFDVQHAIDRLDDLEAAPSPEDVKKAHPWIQSPKALYDAVAGKAAADVSGVLKKQGWTFPPYHGRCRCSVDITEDATFALEKPPPAPAEPAKPSFPWTIQDLSKVNRSLGGAHAKTLFRAPDAVEWMFKPVEKGMEFRALGDEAAAEMARLLGLDTAEVYAEELGDQYGSIQRMFTDIAGDLSGTAPTALTELEAASLEEQHVFDWLISQHDTHSENALRTKDGKLRFIDKGQTFRFFGKDNLDLDWGALGKPNPVETYYHKMFNAYAEGGKVPLKGMKAIEPLLKRIEALPDDAFVKALKPYAQAAAEAAKKHPELLRTAWMGRFNEPEFIQAALARKHSIRADFEKFYKDVEKRRAARLPKATPKGQSPSGTGHDWAGLQNDAKQAKWAGKSFFVTGNDFENMNWLLYDTEGDGVFMEARVREASDAKLKQFLTSVSGKAPLEVADDADSFHADMLKVFKSFNVHMGPNGDKIIPEHTKALAESVSKKLLDAFGAAKPGTILDQQVKHYMGQWTDIYVPLDKKFKESGLGKLFTKAPQFADKSEKAAARAPVIPGLPPGWKVERAKVGDTIGRQLDKGKIRYIGEPQGNYSDKGEIYKFTTPNGHTIIYRPRQAYDEYINPYSLNGHMRFHLNRPMAQLSPGDLEAAFVELKDLGLETKAASLPDFEALQLRKVAFKEKLDAAAWKAAPAKLPVEEQITKLKAFLKSEGHKLPTTSPVPVYEHGKFGPPRFMSDHAGVAESSKYTLSHSLGSNADVPTKLKQILEGGTNALVSSAERLRLGIGGRAGMSPEQDMGTGGANFVYTRIREKGSSGANALGLHFRGELLNDLDAISYEEDMYGKQTDAALKKRVTRAGWSATSDYNSNETLFKHSISLEWLDSIVVASPQHKRAVEKMFADHGIKSLGGKDISTLVRVR